MGELPAEWRAIFDELRAQLKSDTARDALDRVLVGAKVVAEEVTDWPGLMMSLSKLMLRVAVGK